MGIGIGIGVITLGRQSGEYSPPALCLALTAISSAISLETTGSGGKVGIRLECVGGGGLLWTYCCNARRSSRSFPTSWRRIRTSLASALLKSFKYLQRSAKGKSIFLNLQKDTTRRENVLGSSTRRECARWFVRGHLCGRVCSERWFWTKEDHAGNRQL